MNKDQLTCKQRVTVILNFQPRYHEQTDSVIVMKKWRHLHRLPDGKAVRQLAADISKRLECIAGIMETLQAAHSHWAVTSKKDRIIMETDRFDVQQIIDLLAEHDFQAEDYRLSVEYERKWGML